MSAQKQLAKAVQIILALDAEDGLDDYTVSYPIGCTGEYGVSWDEEKLKTLFDVGDEYENSPLAKLTAAADSHYWETLAKKEELDNFKYVVGLLVQEIDNGDVDKEGHVLAGVRSYLVNPHHKDAR